MHSKPKIDYDDSKSNGTILDGVEFVQKNLTDILFSGIVSISGTVVVFCTLAVNIPYHSAAHSFSVFHLFLLVPISFPPFSRILSSPFFLFMSEPSKSSWAHLSLRPFYVRQSVNNFAPIKLHFSTPNVFSNGVDAKFRANASLSSSYTKKAPPKAAYMLFLFVPLIFIRFLLVIIHYVFLLGLSLFHGYFREVAN